MYECVFTITQKRVQNINITQVLVKDRQLKYYSSFDNICTEVLVEHIQLMINKAYNLRRAGLVQAVESYCL